MFIINRIIVEKMSLLELFKQHVHQASHSWHGNELASFYSGYYGRALGLDRHQLKHDLHHCMGYSDEALYYWGQAIKHFNRDGWEEFKLDEARATQMSQPLFQECTTNNKYNFAIAEMNAWMTEFWSKEDATETMVSNIKQHKFKVFIDIALLNAAWAIGYYHGAGVAYGRLWTRLIGQPTWSADPSSIYHYTAEEVAEVKKEVFTRGKTDLC